MTFAAIVGMLSEARLLPGIPVEITGGRPARALAAAERLIEEGATGLVSFGIAGGLAPGLAPGTLILATAVDGIPVAPAWRDTLAARHPWALAGTIAGLKEIIAMPAAKQALFQQTGALAADLESGAVAAVCARRGVDFVVIRAIADPAERGLPPAALVGLAPSGKPDLAAVLASLARHPGQLPALLRVARDTAKALAALRRVRL